MPLKVFRESYRLHLSIGSEVITTKINNDIKKPFIITVDTEGDNLWAKRINDFIPTENAMFLPRFQRLCEKYSFAPVYLANYEMVKSEAFVEFAKDALARQTCEIGMHLHAWNSPPDYKLPETNSSNLPYLMEYPVDIMEEKIKILTYELENTFDTKMLSHRGGRWATNDDYFELLIKYGYKVDCSVTPYVDWTDNVGYSPNSHGTDYSCHPSSPYRIYSKKDKNRYLIEVPVSICKIREVIKPDNEGIEENVKAAPSAINEQRIWLRPQRNNLNKMLYLVDILVNDSTQYLEFMIHSSELMHGGSPTFETAEDIEKLYDDLEVLFEYISRYCYGTTFHNSIEFLEKISAEEISNE